MTQGVTPHRRIGAILVERGLITDVELDAALVEQAECGRPVGEICVDRFGLDRLHLADALAQQWEEIRSVPEPRPAAPVVGVRRMAPPAHAPAEQELRELLAEAQAARAELETKTDELSKRLAALESLVADVTTAIDEIRPADKPEPKRAAAKAVTADKAASADKPAPARAARKPAARRTRAATA